MDRENNSVDGTRDEKMPRASTSDGVTAPEDSVRPELSVLKKSLRIIAVCVFFIALLYVTYQLCFQSFWRCSHLPSCICCTYVAMAILPIALIVVCCLSHDTSVHRVRLEDPSVVAAMIVEANTVESRLPEPEKKPGNFDQKVNDLKNEVARLRRKLGYKEWTEYQVLSLNQMLVDFLKVDDLIASAQLSLAELEDYAEASTTRYDWEQYYRWQNKIEEAIRKIKQLDSEDAKNALKKDEAAEPLRAELRVLYEHVASYHMSWAEGSVILRGIIICGVFTLFPLLLGMGLLPLLHPAGDHILRIFNWGILGISGAITAVLLSLRKSDFVEVGNTEGEKELWRAVLGIGLGLVAGLLSYSLIASKIIFTGGAFPNVNSSSLFDIGLSVVWAVASGFCFEKVFDRMRGATMGGN